MSLLVTLTWKHLLHAHLHNAHPTLLLPFPLVAAVVALLLQVGDSSLERAAEDAEVAGRAAAAVDSFDVGRPLRTYKVALLLEVKAGCACVAGGDAGIVAVEGALWLHESTWTSSEVSIDPPWMSAYYPTLLIDPSSICLLTHPATRATNAFCLLTHLT